MKFGDFLKSTRKEKGFTLDSLACKVGVSKSAISDWENEKYTPTDANNISALESALELQNGDIYKMLYGNPTKPLPAQASEQGSEKAAV